MAASVALHLSGWANFYVVVGSSAGALIGLQFVVMTLIGDAGRASMTQIRAFGTPTVIHFSTALLISATLSIPWESIAGLRAALGIVGIAGSAYGARVIVHALNQRGYQPDLEDWIWYSAMPLVCYMLVFVSAYLLASNTSNALLLIAAAALGLLFIGIHNSWDTVTYVVVSNQAKKNKE